VSGDRIAARSVFWAAEVEASPLARTLGVSLDKAGRVLVQEDLTIPGRPEAFVMKCGRTSVSARVWRDPMSAEPLAERGLGGKAFLCPGTQGTSYAARRSVGRARGALPLPADLNSFARR
jgi:hypothetical protein